MPSTYTLNAWEAAEAIAAGTLTSEALVRDCLERIEERDPAIAAWTYLEPQQALAQARDRAPAGGLLHGIPVGIKDIIDTVDMPTTYGSPIYADHQTAWDAACVALLRQAGAVIMGKTMSTEFAMHEPAKTTNPHNPAHTPGGSSSGSAAAVAAEMVPLALGSQTAGSIVRPASFCGVVGYKPTHSDFSLAGIKLVSQTLDTLGGFARCVQDVSLLRAVLMGSPPQLAGLSEPPRIGLCRTPQWPQATPATQEAVETAARRFADAGARVEDVTLPAEFGGLAEAHRTVLIFECVRCFSYELTQHRDQLDPNTRQLLEPMDYGYGDRLLYSEYKDALQVAETCRGALPMLFAPYDVLLTPSAIGEAPAGLGATGSPMFNRIWTLLHTPALNLPGLSGSQGLPVGVQIVGPPGCDDRLLAVGDWMHPRLA